MEKEIVEEYLSVLSNEWDVFTEVWGENSLSKKPKRIDAIIKSKEFPEKVF